MSTGNVVFSADEESHLTGAESLLPTKGTAYDPMACGLSAPLSAVGHAPAAAVPSVAVAGLPFLDSPQVSSGGNTPRAPYCTGGGHGELVTRTGGAAPRGGPPAIGGGGLISPGAAGSPRGAPPAISGGRSRSLVAQSAVRRWSQSQHLGLDAGRLQLLSEAVAGAGAGAGAAVPPAAASSGFARSFRCSGDGRPAAAGGGGGASPNCASPPVCAHAPIRRANTADPVGLSPLSPPPSAASPAPPPVRSPAAGVPASAGSPLGAPPVGARGSSASGMFRLRSSGHLQGPFDGEAGGSSSSATTSPLLAGGAPARRRYSHYGNSQVAEQPHQPSPPAPASRHYQSSRYAPAELVLPPAQQQQDEGGGGGGGSRLGSPSGGGAGQQPQQAPPSPYHDPQPQPQHQYYLHHCYSPSSLSSPMPLPLPAVAESVLEGPASTDTLHGAAPAALAAAASLAPAPPAAPPPPWAAQSSRLAVSGGGSLSRPQAIPATAAAAAAAPAATDLRNEAAASPAPEAATHHLPATQPAAPDTARPEAPASSTCGSSSGGGGGGSPFATGTSPAAGGRAQTQPRSPAMAAAAAPSAAAAGAGTSTAGAGEPRRDSGASYGDFCCAGDDTPFSPASTAPASSFSAAYNIRLTTGSFCHPPEPPSQPCSAAATAAHAQPPACQALSSPQQLLTEDLQPQQRQQQSLQAEKQQHPPHAQPGPQPPRAAQEQPADGAGPAAAAVAAAGDASAEGVEPQRRSDRTAIGGAGDNCPVREVPRDGLLYLSAAAPAGLALRRAQQWSTNDYEVTRKLYAGYASSVFKASSTHASGDVVLKAYNLSGLSTFLRHQVLRELDIHARLTHTSIVHLIAAFKEGDILVMVQEYVRGGSLDRVRRKLGGRMTEFQSMHLVLLPLLNALVYLHGRGIVHRDIKPENLLFTPEWQLKLCDFGVSICLHEERAVTKTGSKEYMAPEVVVCPLKRGPEDNKDNEQMAYTPAVDVWSLGALMYELLVGFTPFPGGPPARTGADPAAQLRFPSSVSEPARSFVRSCLQLHPGDRPTVQELLQHEWVVTSLVSTACDPG
ncbi:hypothetical protein HXX76_011549 [Chlamydomonas incerta]|uniref:Protein kinase domain-containing protein n=1 Tax=Chlamydomonas incerta TaxID=51695 RepID=A0A835VWT3_CHLIN|nr:hypothetical protein HXX76_011549 [Chlamydomonas incerta]|eukprot:KAG2428429.1 hypothetical protein HXX76_011549 [Chlamydomonas incerta]